MLLNNYIFKERNWKTYYSNSLHFTIIITKKYYKIASTEWRIKKCLNWISIQLNYVSCFTKSKIEPITSNDSSNESNEKQLKADCTYVTTISVYYHFFKVIFIFIVSVKIVWSTSSENWLRNILWNMDNANVLMSQ